jgi:hypothetical protein
MWTDINTEPKQGVVYHVFRGHVMGNPADYKDSNYEGKCPYLQQCRCHLYASIAGVC